MITVKKHCSLRLVYEDVFALPEVIGDHILHYVGCDGI
jgi:hypothetical protein